MSTYQPHLFAGQSLLIEDQMLSENGQYCASLTSTGFLQVVNNMATPPVVKYSTASTQTYPASQTSSGYALRLLDDGQLFIEDQSKNRVWDLKSQGFLNARLFLTDDGELQLGSQEDIKLWDSNAAQGLITSGKVPILTMGRTGDFSFSTDNLFLCLLAKPETGTLELYDGIFPQLTTHTFDISDGKWDKYVFTGEIKGPERTFFLDNGAGVLPPSYTITIDFCTHQGYFKYGIIRNSHYDMYMYDTTAIIFPGHDFKEMILNEVEFQGSKMVMAQQPSDLQKKHVTIIRDVSGEKGSDLGYDTRWWYPTVMSSEDVQLVTLVRDQVNNEVALYELPDQEEKIVTSTDLASYKRLGLTIETFNAEQFKSINITAEIVPIVVKFVASAYPSDILVLFSQGHGGDFSIMNQLIMTECIDKSMKWIIRSIGKKIDIFDFSGNCGVAEIQNMYYLSKYSTYVMASDLERIPRMPYYTHYHECFKSSKSLDVSVNDLMNNIKNLDIFTYDSLQQVTLFKSAEFAPIIQGILPVVQRANPHATEEDVLQDITQNAKKNGLLPYPSNGLEYKNDPTGKSQVDKTTYKQVDLKYLIKTCYPDYAKGSFESDWSNLVGTQVNNSADDMPNSPHGIYVQNS